MLTLLINHFKSARNGKNLVKLTDLKSQLKKGIISQHVFYELSEKLGYE